MQLSSLTGANIVLTGLTIPTGESVSLTPAAYLADEGRRARINELYEDGKISVTEEDNADGDPDFTELPGEVFPTLTAGETEESTTGDAETFEIHITRAGALTVAAGVQEVPLPHPGRLIQVIANVATPPVGAAILLDVNKNGTTVFTTQADRIALADGGSGENQHVAADWEADDTAARQFEALDLVSVDVDQIGSGTAGSNLDVVLVFERHAVPVETDS